MEIRSPLPDISIPEISLPELILNNAKSYSERLAFIDDRTGRTMTFSEFADDVNRLARGLCEIGLRKGDVVAIFLPNSIEYAIILHGVLLAGGTVTGLIPACSEKIMKEITENAQPSYIFTSTALLCKLNNILPSCANLQEIFLTEGDAKGLRSYKEILKLGDDCDHGNIKLVPDEDAAVIFYTSGSTGERKGGVHTHRSIVANILQMSDSNVSLYTGCDVTIALRPAGHAYGFLVYFTVGLYNGCTLVFLDDYGPVSLLKAMEKYKVTVLAFTPHDIVHLSKQPLASSYDVSSLKTVLYSGGPLSRTIREMFMSVFKVKDVRDAYGMTEVMFISLPKKTRPYAGVGVPLPNIRLKVLDITTGETLDRGNRGELWIRSPCVAKQYKGKPRETANTFVDGWVKTGDVVWIDDLDNIHLVDRLKDIIYFKTFKLAPRDLENVIQDLPGVDSVVAVGVPDEENYEVAKIFVVKSARSGITEQDIIAAVQELTPELVWSPGNVIFLKELPVGPTGKVLRSALKGKYVDKIREQ